MKKIIHGFLTFFPWAWMVLAIALEMVRAAEPVSIYVHIPLWLRVADPLLLAALVAINFFYLGTRRAIHKLLNPDKDDLVGAVRVRAGPDGQPDPEDLKRAMAEIATKVKGHARDHSNKRSASKRRAPWIDQKDGEKWG